MKKDNKNIFEKGNFEPINTNFILDGLNALTEISKVQRKYRKKDMDTLLNELHDSIVGRYLGFAYSNTEKHGFDCKNDENGHVTYLEQKSASWDFDNDKKIAAVFNDTSEEKARAFKDKRVFLALSAWNSASELMFICYGQHEGIGDYLERRVKEQEAKSQRRTQSIQLSTLILKYGFKILAINKTPEEVYTLLTLSNKALYKMDRNCIISLKDYVPITQ